jgi:hypothetical protein
MLCMFYYTRSNLNLAPLSRDKEYQPNTMNIEKEHSFLYFTLF